MVYCLYPAGGGILAQALRCLVDIFHSALCKVLCILGLLPSPLLFPPRGTSAALLL